MEFKTAVVVRSVHARRYEQNSDAPSPRSVLVAVLFLSVTPPDERKKTIPNREFMIIFYFIHSFDRTHTLLRHREQHILFINIKFIVLLCTVRYTTTERTTVQPLVRYAF